MIQFTVIFYEDITGDKPVENFLLSLDIKMRAKLIGILQILQEKGNQLREPYSKHLEDGIFEIRGKVGSDITRVLYFFLLRRQDNPYEWVYQKNSKNAPQRDKISETSQTGLY